MIDGGLVLFAGALMLTPGFVTDATGLLLLLPPTRLPVRRLLKRRFRGRITTFTASGPGFSGRGGSVVDVDGHEATDSDNRIHSDDVAKQYGFRGGLVPGVSS